MVYHVYEYVCDSQPLTHSNSDQMCRGPVQYDQIGRREIMKNEEMGEVSEREEGGQEVHLFGMYYWSFD